MTEFFDTLMLYPKLALGIAVLLLMIVFIFFDAIIRIVRLIKREKEYEYRVVRTEESTPEAENITMLCANKWQICTILVVDVLHKTPIRKETIYVLKRPKTRNKK